MELGGQLGAHNKIRLNQAKHTEIQKPNIKNLIYKELFYYDKENDKKGLVQGNARNG